MSRQKLEVHPSRQSVAPARKRLAAHAACHHVEELERRLFLSTTSGTFGVQQPFPTGPQPRSVARGDVKGEGKVDMIVDNGGKNTVGVRRVHRNGTFQTQRTFSTGASPFSVFVSDVNADGKPDLLVANNSGNSVSLLLGNGNGTFQAQKTFAAGTTASFVTADDVNGGGKPGVLVANYGSNTVSLLLGNGNGTFQTQQILSTGTKPSSIAVADFNKDGKPDLAIANKGSNTISILLGNGNGTFQNQKTFATGSLPFSVAAADLNGDGKIDLAVADETSNAVSILLGNGNGTFQTQQTFAVGSIPASVAISDFNGDGKPDVAVANYSGNTISVLLGNGNGTLQPQVTYATGSSPFALVVADVNKDGVQDILVANEGSNTAGVFLGNVTVISPQPIPTPDHVVVVMEENEGAGEIIGNSQAPYINSLAQQGALFTNFFAITHPSQPDYLALFSGSTQGVTDDTVPSSQFSGPDFGSQVIAAGLSFTGYSEDLPSAGSLAVTAGPIDPLGNPLYARKHNPWSDFSDLPGSTNQPYTSFPQNYSSLPTVSFVVPNLMNDMHDGTIAQGDQWLQTNLTSYANWAQTHNSLLIVTWDESSQQDSTNQVVTIFYGQPVEAGAYGQSIDQYGLLRTLESMYHLPAFDSAGRTPSTPNTWLPSVAITPAAGGVTLAQDHDHQHIDWTVGTATSQLSISDSYGLTINGTGGTNLISLNYSNGNPLPVNLHLNGTFTINGLSGSNPLANTNLEIGRSTVYISYSSSDPLSLIQGYLRNGYNNGAWSGVASQSTGVITSIPAAQNAAQTTSIGYADSADGVIAGQPANTIELKYTLYGDTSLTGSVGFNDFTRLTQHYNQKSGGTWDTGDFNYDGSMNVGDFTLLSRTYNTGMTQATAAAVQAGSTVGQISFVTASPTPTQMIISVTPPPAQSSSNFVPKHRRKRL
jgi:hypothetical protein